MIEPYYSKEKAEELHRLRDAAGGTAFDEAWTALIADIRADIAADAGPHTTRALALAQRWNALVDRFTNGDLAVERTLYEAADKFRRNAELQGAPVPNVVAYMRQIFEAHGLVRG
jgi:hypothetical protein